MKQYEQTKEVVTIGKKEYQALLTMYNQADNEYSKFVVTKIFPDDELQKAAAKLVNKGFAIYSDNTNKIQISLNGFNIVAHPPGLSVYEQNLICYMFNPPTKLKLKGYTPLSSNSTDPKEKKVSRGSTMIPGIKKIDIVRKYLDKGQDPQQIFDSMAKDGIQTTVGSVRCFIKTINDLRKQESSNKKSKK